MFIVSNLLIAAAKILDIALSVMFWLIMIRALISWVNPDPYNMIVQFLYRATEPVLKPIRDKLPYTAVDISPVIAFIGIVFIRSFIVRTIFDIAMRLR
ncbi:MAG: YggT family protein [Elusimicrobia bacterium]|nr:YggT family protein [Elusimicrobiota bacterium]